MTLGGVHIAPHGEASKTSPRSEPARQADSGLVSRGNLRSDAIPGISRECFCSEWRFEGREGQSESANPPAAACNSQVSGQKALGIASKRRLLTRPRSLTDDRFLPRNQRVEYPEVTVCIAARAGNVIFGASDRMLTSGDVQFEPSAGTKIIQVTTSMFVMTAGDAALQAEVVGALMREVAARIQKDQASWFRVQDAADIYVEKYNEARNKRAESAILSPLFLDRHSFVSDQKMLAENLASDISKELLNFSMPGIAAIVAGLDSEGSHIYLIQEGETTALEANCVDSVGFASIGMGRRHASSQFMFARHAWNSPIADTLLLTYHAKKKSEVAPGVGLGTDMVMVNGLGGFTVIGDHVLGKLEQEHQKITEEENSAFAKARGEISRYVEEIGKQADASAAAATTQQPPAKVDDTNKPPDGVEVSKPS